MSDWKKVVFNGNQVIAETDKAVLIKLPKDEHAFWHPRKCVRSAGKGGYHLTISFTDSFNFKCFRKGKKTGQVTSSFQLSGSDFFQKYGKTDDLED